MPDPQPFVSTIQSLISLGLDLIPLRAGGKRPTEAAWNKPVPRKVDAVLQRFGTNKNDPVSTHEFTQNRHNIGVLNESSKTITLDCDSPLAVKALIAAADASGGDIDALNGLAGWISSKGPKVIFRRPARMAPGRAVFRVWNAQTNTFDVIFELRGVGQDVLPGSYREDMGQHLEWNEGAPPTKLVVMPAWMVRLYHELLTGKGPLINAMYVGIGVDPVTAGGRASGTFNMAGYPPELAHAAFSRAHVNAHYAVPELLSLYGYQRDGKRWKPATTTTSAGIIPPRDGHDENWICEHESDVLAGVFDAWRIIVEHEYNGDVAKAIDEVRATMRAAVKPASPVPVQQPGADNNKKKTNDKSKKVAPVRGQDPGNDDPGQDHEQGAEQPPAHSKPPKARVSRGDGSLSASFLSDRVETTAPIIRGLLSMPPGVHMLSAMPKVGKSIYATGVALTAATGVPISGTEVDAPMPVLYCCFDESLNQTFRPRVQRAVQRFKLPTKHVRSNLKVFGNIGDLLTWALDEGIDTLEPLPFEVPYVEVTSDMDDDAAELAEAHNRVIRSVYAPQLRALYRYVIKHGIKFAVIDVLSKIRAADEHQRNAYLRDMQEIGALNELFVEAGCAALVVHHMNKQGGKKAGDGDSHLLLVSGTNAIAGSTQSIISMMRVITADMQQLYAMDPPGNKITLQQSARETKDLQPTALSLRAEALEGWSSEQPALWFDVMGDATMLVGSDVQQALAEFLYDHAPNEWVEFDACLRHCKQVGLVAGQGRAAVLTALKALVGIDTVASKRGGGGGYQLTSEGREKITTARAARGY